MLTELTCSYNLLLHNEGYLPNDGQRCLSLHFPEDWTKLRQITSFALHWLTDKTLLYLRNLLGDSSEEWRLIVLTEYKNSLAVRDGFPIESQCNSIAHHRVWKWINQWQRLAISCLIILCIFHAFRDGYPLQRWESLTI